MDELLVRIRSIGVYSTVYEKLFFYDYLSDLMYPIMGVVTQYLIITDGIERCLKVYTLSEPIINKRCKEISDRRLTVLETECLEYGRLFKLDYAMRMRILEVLGERPISGDDFFDTLKQMQKITSVSKKEQL